MRIIRLGLLCLFCFLVVLGVIKDKVFDTPARSKARIAQVPGGLNTRDIPANIFYTSRDITYRLFFFSVIPAGRLEFRSAQKDGDRVFSFEALTQGSFMENFIKASARVESYFSGQPPLPYKYREVTTVREKTKSKEILYDRVNMLAVRQDKKVKIPEDVYDPIGSFIHLLTLPFEKGKQHRIKLISGDDLYIMQADILDDAHGIARILIDIKREDRTSSHGAKFQVWVTNDNARIPLVFKCWSPAGYASVVLENCKINDKSEIRISSAGKAVVRLRRTLARRDLADFGREIRNNVQMIKNSMTETKQF